jgi:F0F1-type ATP synthase gamma subunit
MQVAEKNVQQRQNRINDELFDVVSGFDALDSGL